MQLLTLREVLARTGLSRSSLFRYRQAGVFPLPVQLAASSRHIAWRSSDVDHWCAENIPAPRVHRDP